MAKSGRPKLSVEDKFVFWGIKWPPRMLAELREEVPDRQRAEFVRQLVAKGLAAVARKKKD